MVWIYHERQNSNLCGLHALNNMFQTKTFTRDELNVVARDMDRREQRLLGISGGPSSNYDSTGNYSVQVLQTAMQNKGISLVNLGEEEVRATPAEQFEAFICHREAHWIAIRKIGQKFWNLNSFLAHPQPINSYTLVTQITTLKNNNYTVFVALASNWREGGKLPPSPTGTPNRNLPKLKYYWNGDKLLEKASGDDSINFASGYSGGTGWSYEEPKETVVEHEANATKDAWINMAAQGVTLNKPAGGGTAKTFEELHREEYEVLETRPFEEGSLKLKLKVGRATKSVAVDADDTIRYLYALALKLAKEANDANVTSGKQLQLQKARKREVLLDLDQTVKAAGLARSVVTGVWV